MAGRGCLWPGMNSHCPKAAKTKLKRSKLQSPMATSQRSHEKSHIVSHSPTVLSHRETNEHFCKVFVMFCCSLMSMVSLRYITMRSISNLEEIIRYHKRSAWRQSSEIISQDTGSILQLTMALGVLFVEGIVKRFAGIHVCPFWAKLSNSRQYQ